jgi:8-oxo-dGTP pyrophosphatase MutT (NUDIX family)
MSSSSNNNKVTHAYVIPHRSNKQVLVGTKQVISYGALRFGFYATSKQRMRLRLKAQQPLIEQNANGTVLVGGVGRRLEGHLQPGGGKPSFFGGKIKGQESPKQAAIRELQEELHLNLIPAYANVVFDEDALIEVFRSEWGGVYYLLALDAFDEQTTNGIIETFEKYTRRYGLGKASKCDNPPEMHMVQWVSLSKLVEAMAQVDEAFITQEILLYSRYFCKNVLALPEDTVQVQFCTNTLFEHMTLYEPVESNIEAALATIDRLKKFNT